MDTRNPSPPREAPNEGAYVDNIGDTAYSKRWLYSLILKVLKILQSEPSAFEHSETFSDELDPELEEELCCLWDITVNKEIIPHLHEFHLVPVFAGSMTRNFCPRLTEICLGVLANLALNERECAQMTEESQFIVNTFDLMACTDTRILMEVFRLLQSVLASHNQRQIWLESIHFSPEFFDRVVFILLSSTNAGLLVNTISAVETIVRIDDSISELWCTCRLLNAILEAQRQMKWLYGDEVEIIHRLLYIFSSNSKGVQTLMSCFNDVYLGFGVYLRKVCEDDPHLIPFDKYHNSLRAVVPVIDVIVSNLPAEAALTALDCDPDILPCLLKIAWGCLQQENSPCLISLSGLIEDITVLFGDLMLRAQELLQEKLQTAGSSVPVLPTRALKWFYDLEKSSTPRSLREAFVRCCLRGRKEVRGYLVFACHQLHLEALLECVTDEN